ncbi:MAG: hypothetical protein ACK5X3_18960 [Pseudomonadota bacterium]|jgi:hypothetical protein
MTDWIEHDGGPQPVADDVWVEVRQLYQADDRDLATWIAWDYKLRYRILNQHLIDAARREGIRLGLEAAEQAVLKAENTLENEWRAGDKSNSHLEGRSNGMGEAADIIRNINPEPIAREAQDMGSGKETT